MRKTRIATAAGCDCLGEEEEEEEERRRSKGRRMVSLANWSLTDARTHTHRQTRAQCERTTGRWNVTIDGRGFEGGGAGGGYMPSGHFNLVFQRQTLTTAECSRCSQNWFAQRHLKPPRPFLCPLYTRSDRQTERVERRASAVCEWKDTLLISNFTLCCVKINTDPTFHTPYSAFGIRSVLQSTPATVESVGMQIEIAARRKTQLMKPERLAHPISRCPPLTSCQPARTRKCSKCSAHFGESKENWTSNCRGSQLGEPGEQSPVISKIQL